MRPDDRLLPGLTGRGQSRPFVEVRRRPDGRCTTAGRRPRRPRRRRAAANTAVPAPRPRQSATVAMPRRCQLSAASGCQAGASLNKEATLITWPSRPRRRSERSRGNGPRVTGFLGAHMRPKDGLAQAYDIVRAAAPDPKPSLLRSALIGGCYRSSRTRRRQCRRAPDQVRAQVLELGPAAEAVDDQVAVAGISSLGIDGDGGLRRWRARTFGSHRSSPILRDTGSWRASNPNDPAKPQQPASSTSTL